MKTDNKIKYLPLFVTVLLSLIMLTLSVWAGQTGSISYLYVTEGVEFNAYRAGDINSDGSLALSGKFADYSVSLTDTSAAATLAAYAGRDNISPVLSVKTDSENTALFSGLDRGIYLIVGESAVKDKVKYTALPVLVMVTGDDSIITVNGKFEAEKIPDNSGGGSPGSGGGGSSTGEEGGKESSSTGEEGGKDSSSIGEEGGRDSSSTSEEGGGGSSSSVNPKNISVLKVWSGEKSEAEITAQLLKNGAVYDEVVLNSDNNWRHTWESVSRTDTWSVVEKQVPDGYVVSIDRDGSVFVITNTPEEDIPDSPELPLIPGNPDNPDNPDTPDNPDNPEIPYNPENPDTPETDNDTPDGTISSGGNGSSGGSDISEGSSDSSAGNPGQTTASTSDETLPQTGQLWWPVALLLCFGVLFLITGIGLRREGR